MKCKYCPAKLVRRKTGSGAQRQVCDACLYERRAAEYVKYNPMGQDFDLLDEACEILGVDD